MLSTKDSFSRVDKLDVLLSTEDSKQKYSCSHFDSLSHHGRLALACYLLMKTVESLPVTKIGKYYYLLKIANINHFVSHFDLVLDLDCLALASLVDVACCPPDSTEDKLKFAENPSQKDEV